MRHHHLICMQNFVGKGYDERFVNNMRRVMEDLKGPEARIRLAMECDDICSCCPNRTGDECQDENSVIGKDRSVARFLGLPEELSVQAGPLMEEIGRRMMDLEDIGSLCGKCEWSDLCNERQRLRRGV